MFKQKTAMQKSLKGKQNLQFISASNFYSKMLVYFYSKNGNM